MLNLKNIKNLAKLLLLFFLAYFLYLYFANNIDAFLLLRIQEPVYIVFAILLMVLHIGFTGALNGVALAALNRRISKKDEFLLAAITRLANYVLPFKVGMLYRARYLKAIAKLSYTEFTVTSVVIFLLALMLSAWVGIFAISLQNIGSPYLFLLYGLIAISVPLFLYLSRHLNFYLFRIKTLESVSASWWSMVKNRQFIKKGLFFITLQIFVSAVIFMLNFNALGHQLPLSVALILTSAEILTFVFQITPAGIGVIEVTIIALAFALNVDDVTAVAALLMMRVLTLLTAVTISAYGLPYLEKKISAEELSS